jgi:serine/threonine protein kinase
MNTAEIFTRLYAHSTVYADISPENIFASGNLESSEVWLIDADNMRYRFDVGKQIQTPGYGAPEIMKGELNSLQADEYSFAILAHEILTMNSPFNGELLTDGDGGGWDDEEVDYADLASKGEVAWIYDENDDSNRCHTGLGPKYAFTKNIKKLFEGNFGEKGRHDPLSRPKMRDWYIALRQAANLTAKCKYCGSTFLVQLEDIQNCKCPFCKIGRENDRAPFIAAIIMDYFNVDKIVANVNEEIDSFNADGGYGVETVSLDLLKRKEPVSIKIIDNMDGDYFLYNYHTSDTSFSERVEKSIEIEISKGEYTIRNLMNRSVRIGTPNSDYGEIMPNSSKRLSDINNIILTMSVLRGDMTDYLGDEEFTTDDIMHLRERKIQFVLV